MIQIYIILWGLKIIIVSLNPNGFVVLRLGTGRTISWSVISIFYDRADCRLNIQLCSRKALRIGGRRG